MERPRTDADPVLAAAKYIPRERWRATRGFAPIDCLSECCPRWFPAQPRQIDVRPGAVRLSRLRKDFRRHDAKMIADHPARSMKTFDAQADSRAVILGAVWAGR
jgi:hypothetical protein